MTYFVSYTSDEFATGMRQSRAVVYSASVCRYMSYHLHLREATILVTYMKTAFNSSNYF
jgi:hypothetical protein